MANSTEIIVRAVKFDDCYQKHRMAYESKQQLKKKTPKKPTSKLTLDREQEQQRGIKASFMLKDLLEIRRSLLQTLTDTGYLEQFGCE